jgi:hypothetical protein
MPAPQQFADWMSGYTHVTKSTGIATPYRYHPRSNAVSIRLGEFIAADLYAASRNLQARVARGEAAYSVDEPFLWEVEDEERIDLAIGIPATPPLVSITPLPRSKDIHRLFVALEAKTAMTEHIGAKPRLRRELISAHVLTHQRDQQAIAAGITIINLADRYVSPTAQVAGATEHKFTTHNQPHDAEDLMRYLRRMKVRDSLNETGWDAYCHIVISCDNLGPCTLVTDPPAPQPGDSDHYETFLARLVTLFDRRFP